MVRCPECSVDLDVDEDEVEEGEILNCPECEVEIEVVQVHPVRLNVISDEDDDEEEADDEGKEGLESDALTAAKPNTDGIMWRTSRRAREPPSARPAST